MIKLILCDFSWTLLHPVQRDFVGSINGLNKTLGGGDPFGQYSFFNYFVMNKELLQTIKSLKSKYSLTTCLFTTDIIQERIEIKGDLAVVFDCIISGHTIVNAGLTVKGNLAGTKTNPQVYKFIAAQFDALPEEGVFIDDSWENLEAAQKAGFKIISYPRLSTMKESNQIAIKQLKDTLSICT